MTLNWTEALHDLIAATTDETSDAHTVIALLHKEPWGCETPMARARDRDDYSIQAVLIALLQAIEGKTDLTEFAAMCVEFDERSKREAMRR